MTNYSNAAILPKAEDSTEEYLDVDSDDIELRAPWYTFYNGTKALLDDDPDIVITEFDNNNHTFSIYIGNFEKYLLLNHIFKKKVVFGRVTLTVSIEYTGEKSTAEIYSTLFADNPHFSTFIEAELPTGDIATYCAFKKEVLQFENDDISNPYGVWSGLAEDIAKKIFSQRDANMRFCTDIDEETKEETKIDKTF